MTKGLAWLATEALAEAVVLVDIADHPDG